MDYQVRLTDSQRNHAADKTRSVQFWVYDTSILGHAGQKVMCNPEDSLRNSNVSPKGVETPRFEEKGNMPNQGILCSVVQQ